MTARLPGDRGNTRLTLSARPEDPWRDARTDALDQRQRVILAGRARDEWLRPKMVVVPPPRIDWWRVAALLIVAGAAALTFLGIYVLLVYFLTAF